MSASRCARSRSHSASDSALISWTGELSGPETAPKSLQTLLQMALTASLPLQNGLGRSE